MIIAILITLAVAILPPTTLALSYYIRRKFGSGRDYKVRLEEVWRGGEMTNVKYSILLPLRRRFDPWRSVETGTIGWYYDENNNYVGDAKTLFSRADDAAKEFIKKDIKQHRECNTVSYTFDTTTGEVLNLKGSA